MKHHLVLRWTRPAVAALLLVFIQPCFGESTSDFSYPIFETSKATNKYYYYSPTKLGASAFHNPLSMFVEGGLGALHNKRLDTVRWGVGAEEVWDQLTNPYDRVTEFGTKDFLLNEFIPNFGKGRNFSANYLWHFIGGGFRNTLMEEYYDYHGYKHPKTMAWLTMYSMHIVNEIVQAEHFSDLYDEKGAEFDSNRAVDALPDLLFFDWVGKVFFSFPVVNEFASRKLHLRDWTHQSQYNISTNRLMNNGQLFWMRYKIYGPLSVSTLSGEQISSANITLDVFKDYQLSFGMGVKPKTFYVDSSGNIDADSVVRDFGLFISKNDNPIVVATYEPEDKGAIQKNPQGINEYTEKTIINVYPGIFEFHGIRPGLTLSYQKEAYFLGLSISGWPTGLIFSTPQQDKYRNAL